MRQIRELLSFIFLLGICFDMMSDTGSIKYSLTLSMDDVVIDTTSVQGTPFTTVAINNFSNMCDDNEPALPVKTVSFQVPTYCNNVRARILSSRYLDSINVDYAVLPGMNIPTRSDFTLEPNMYATTGEGYARVEAGPSVRVCDEFFVNANDHIVTLGICPVAYDHSFKNIVFYSDVHVELSYDLCGKAEMKFSPFDDEAGDKIVDVAQFVENGYASDKQKVGSLNNKGVTIPIKNYVIIVPEKLKSYVTTLSKWKEQKGYNVLIKSVESILNTPQFAIGSNEYCFDKESSVRQWLKMYYKEKRAFYCLIVGDHRTTAPIRKFYAMPDYKTDSDPTNPNSEDYNPSDAYFSDLVTDWKFEKYPCGLYSCDLTKVNFSPTIPVGRLLCSTGEEIERYTEKLLLYELYPGRGNADYLSKGFMVRHKDGFSGNRSLFDELQMSEVEILKDNQASEISDLRPLGKDVIASMRKSGLMSWQCHGEPISIMCAVVKDTTGHWPRNRFVLAQEKYRNFHDRYSPDIKNGLDCLDNEDYPSVAYSLACTIAPFDDLSEKYNWNGNSYEYNMGSAFTVAGDYGGPALLGNTRNGYWSSSSVMEKEFGKQLKNNSCIGIAEMLSKISQTDKRIVFRHNIIGDPEFNIWTDKPSYFTGTSIVNGNVFSLVGNSIQKGFYGVMSGNVAYQSKFDATENQLSISLPKYQIATIYIWQDNYLPITQIITTGGEIENENMNIVVREALFSSDSKNGKNFEIGKHPVYINVGTNSEINIRAMDKIASDSGIIIQNEGALIINTNRAVLKGDKVKTGGSLRVKSNQITLEAGVEIEAGAVAEFTTN